MGEPALFHTADLHTGAYRFLSDQLDRCKEMFDGIARLVVEYQAEEKILVVAGDALDRKNITEEERNLLLSFIVYLVHKHVHVVIVNGNHDYYTEALTLLQPLKIIEPLNKYLHVVLGKPARVTIGDIGFGCVPCQQDLTTEQLLGIARTLRKEAPCRKFYMVVHEAIHGSTNFRGTWKAKSDKYLKLPKLDFVTGWMLGDIHTRQSIMDNAWYCGSPIQVKSDENPNTGIIQWIGSSVKFHKIKTRGFRFTNDPKEALKLAADGHYVRFKGRMPEGIEFPPNVVFDGELAAIEIDLDLSEHEEVGEFKVAIDLISPLPNFLASRGVQPKHQRMALDIVSQIAQSRNSVETVEVEDECD